MVQPQRDRSFRITSAVLFAVGACLAALWLVTTVPTLLFLARAQSAPATYVDSVSASGYGGGAAYRPRFRFRTRDGQEVVVKATSNSEAADYEDGKTVRVFYDRNNPSHAQLNLFLDLWIGPVLLGGFTAALLGMAALFWRVSRT